MLNPEFQLRKDGKMSRLPEVGLNPQKTAWKATILATLKHFMGQVWFSEPTGIIAKLLTIMYRLG